MSPSKKDDALVVVKPSDYAIVQHDDAAAFIKDNLEILGVTPFQLPQIGAPRQGGKTFTIHDPTEGEVETDELTGIILAVKANLKAWYREPYGPQSEKGPPSCSSSDGVEGYGVRSVSGDTEPCWAVCGECEWNEYGSHRGGSQGKDCQDYALLFVLREDDMLPSVLKVSPTSLKSWKSYVMGLMSKGRGVHSVVSRITATKAKTIGGYDVSELQFAAAAKLEKADFERVSEAQKAMNGWIARQFQTSHAAEEA